MKIKEYEATVKEIDYIKKNDHNISVDQYEKAIISLENDVDKGEMIPKERAIEVLKKDLVNKEMEFYERIYDYWIVRREIFQKSLLRKFWKDQKYTDKYLQTTFRKREREKMKTRKNKSQHDECLRKLYDMKNYSSSYLKELIKYLEKKEKLKRKLIQIKQLEFEIKVSSTKQERNRFELKLKDLLRDFEQITPPTLYHEHKVVPTVQPEAQPVTITPLPIKDIKRKHKVNLHHEPTTEVKKEKQTKEKEGRYLRYRVRINNRGMTIVDRYIQSDLSFNPFDDDFNRLIIGEQVVPKDSQKEIKESNAYEFSDCYYDYLKNIYKDIPAYSDDEDDVSIDNNDIKVFSNACKQFLKNKRMLIE